MSKQTGTILVVDDDASAAALVATALETIGHKVVSASSGEEALEKVHAGDHDMVITDVQMGGMSGIELSQTLATERSDLPVIVMTGHASVQTAVDAIRVGAYDFLTKPVDLDQLEHTVERTLEHHRLRAEVKRLRRAVDARHVGELVGESSSMHDARELIARVARTDVSVLLTGESGTGKEVAARQLHDLSGRAEGPFTAINCAALPETLLESELFGHEKGAFTDAKRARRGLFLEADGGTLLLDEIGEMPASMQAKLLRAIQERRVRPVGSDQMRSFDTRIIAATNRDLRAEIEDGSFREDLYYRLNVVQIELPPLRARGNDVLLLAQTFLQRFAQRHNVPLQGISAEAGACLLRYDWPGNVRELMNAIERGVALARYDELQEADLPERIREHTPTRLSFEAHDPEGFVALEELERRYILKVLEAVGGNKSESARILGIDRKTLHRKLTQYEEKGLT